MKILHVIANLAPRYGGPPKACLEMAQAVAARGHEVHIYTSDQDGDRRLDVPMDRPVLARGVHIHYFASSLRRLWPISLPMARALAQNTENYDVVHIHSLYLFHGAAAGHFCRKYHVPYLIRPHGTLDPFIYSRHRARNQFYELLIEHRNIQGATAVHFTAERERQLAQPYLPHSRAIVVPLGLNMEDYEILPPRGAFRQKYAEMADSTIILHLGRLNFKKGLDILVDAFARVVHQDEDVHLVLAGPDNEGYGSSIRKWVEAHEVGDRVTFTGMLRGEEKLAALRDADIFALPSYSENFGLAIVEAMACGLPVVISDNVNIWREVDRAGAGIVTPARTDAVSRAISQLTSSRDLRNQMGEAGRGLVRERYQWKDVAQELENAYMDIIRGKTYARSARPG